MLKHRGIWTAFAGGWIFFWPFFASASDDFQKGKAFFQSFDFEKTILFLKKTLEDKKSLSNDQRLQAFLMISVSYYNQSDLPSAKKWYEQALEKDKDAQPPGDLSPFAKKFFAKIRDDKKKGLQKNPPPRRLPEPPPPSFAQRHWLAITLLSVGLAAVAGGAVTAVLFQGKQQEYQAMLDKQKENPLASQISGSEWQKARGDANTTGLAATLLFGGGGALIAASIVVFLVQSFSAPPPPSTPQKDLKSNVLFQSF